MSLLLDALKKAADDKQKASQSKAADNGASLNDSSAEDKTIADSHVVPAAAAIVPQSIVESDDEELSLDIIEEDQPSVDPASSVAGDDQDDVSTEDDAEIPPRTPSDTEPPLEILQASSPVSSNTVSDEALALLINKTNRDVRKGKRYFIVSTSLLAMAILFTGGIYYYFDMQSEMESLERKHSIAMQAMRLKTGVGSAPEESEIIRNFVNKAEPEENIKLAKKRIADEKRSGEHTTVKRERSKGKASKAVIDKGSNKIQGSKGILSIQKTNKSDPLGDKLDAAWLAYDSGRYEESKAYYAEVLHLEKNNRDAMLGLAAIAIHDGDASRAKRYYQALLELDPRDPIATAGIASLHNDKDVIKSDEQYLLSMLDKNPKEAHLNFALGNIYAQNGEWRTAQKYYFNAWKQDSENADYLFNMAISMDQLGKSQQALKFYSESLRKSENRQVGFSREAVQQRIKVLSEL